MKSFSFSDALHLFQDNIQGMKDTLHAYRKDGVKEQTEYSMEGKPSSKESAIYPSNIEHWKFWIIGLVVVALGFFMYTIFSRVLLIFTAVVIAIALESMIFYIEKKTKKRRLGIIVAYLSLIGLLLSGVLVMIPFLVNQVSDLITVVVAGAQHIEILLKTNTLQDAIQSMHMYSYLQSFGIDLAEPKYISYLQSLLQNNLSAIITFSSAYAKGAGQVVVSTVGGVIAALTQIGFVLTLSILLSIEKVGFISFILRLSGDSYVARKKIDLLYQKLGFWLRTQILLGVYIGITMWIALFVLSMFGFDIMNKGSLATISALTELIPYLGPLIGGIPVVLLSTLSYGFTGFIVAGLTVFCVQRIENNILIPLMFKQNLGVSPVLIFLCMVLGGVTVGINGVILAIPIAVIISILFSPLE